MKIIITGAGGFLGSELVTQLLKSKKDIVYALTSHPELLQKKWDKEKNVLVLEKNSLFNSIIKVDKKDVLINCAFPRDIQEDMAGGLEYVKDVIQTSVDAGVGAVINISSQSVYGTRREKYVTEAGKIHLESQYAVGKYATELLTQSLCRNIAYTNIRLASMIGPGFDQRVTNKLIDIALKQKCISINTGKQYWGFLDVVDGAKGIISLLSLEPGKWKKMYNLGGEKAYTLLEIAETISLVLNKYYGIKISIKCIPDEKIFSSGLDSSSLKKDTGFWANTSLEESVLRITQQKLKFGGE